MNTKNKLWILRPQKDLPSEYSPWEPWYDKAFGFVISAESEEAARKIAHENAGYENGVFLGKYRAGTTQSPWLEPQYSTCIELTNEHPEGIVIRDFASA